VVGVGDLARLARALVVAARGVRGDVVGFGGRGDFLFGSVPAPGHALAPEILCGGGGGGGSLFSRLDGIHVVVVVAVVDERHGGGGVDVTFRAHRQA